MAIELNLTRAERITTCTNRYMEAAVDKTKHYLLFLGLFLGLIPGFIYIAYTNSRRSNEMLEIKNQISRIPLLDDETKRAYEVAIQTLKKNGLDVSGFVQPDAREKEDVISALGRDLLYYAPNAQTISFIKSSKCMTSITNIISKAVGNLPDRSLDAIRNIPDSLLDALIRMKEEKNDQEKFETSGTLENFALYLAEIVHKFVRFNKSAEDVNQCLNLMERFLNLPDHGGFVVNTEFLNGFTVAFCNHKDEMIRDVEAAEKTNHPSGNRDKLWKKIDRNYLPPSIDDVAAFNHSQKTSYTKPFYERWTEWLPKPIALIWNSLHLSQIQN